jgi:hypothetical protein
MDIPETHARFELQSDWNEYYRLRNRARFGIVGLILVLFLLAAAPSLLAKVTDLVSGLSPGLQKTLGVSAIGLFALLPCALLLQWIEWRCPRCGKKFAQPSPGPGIAALIAVFWRLLADSRCGSCHLRCGS